MSELKPIPSILLRKLERLIWVDPKQALINLRWLEQNLPPDLDERVRRLRTNKLKELREARVAALFAFGISTVVKKCNVAVLKVEDSDYDCLLHWVESEANNFCAVQLKELPPEDLNPRIELDNILRGLDRYSGEQDLTVVVYLNRAIRFEYSPDIKRPDAKIRELWYLGCQSEDQSSWFIYGDVLSQIPLKYDFQYPQGQPNVS
jgi:hypothetical protein